MRKKLVSILACAAIAATLLAGCGGGSSSGGSTAGTDSAGSTGEAAAPAADAGAGSVYYLNFKPEVDQAWQDLAAAYTEETGVPVTVVTAASGEYETTLMSEMAKSEAPTLFQVNGPVGLANWKDYCYDLTGSEIVGNLTSDAYALKDGDAIDGIDNTDAIKGTYLDQYKNLFDLYITDSTSDPKELSAKTADDARAEFMDGEAVFYQNGSWEYSDTGLAPKFAADEVAMIPIYFGVDDANEGLCTGTENYWCVNAEASEEDIAATLAFMNWCVTSETGTKTMAETMGFTIPFTTAVESPNPFVKQDAAYTAAGKTPVSWNFTTMPSENWKNGVGSALTGYAAGTGSWDEVVSAFVDGWAAEAALAE